MKRSKLTGNRGSVTLETFFVTVCFFVFLMLLTDMVKICYAWGAVQYATNQAARYGCTAGRSTAEITARVLTFTTGLGVQNAVVTVTNEAGQVNPTMPGPPFTYFVLKVTAPVNIPSVSTFIRLITGSFPLVYNVTAFTVIRNEP